jgi:hypothetical protein
MQYGIRHTLLATLVVLLTACAGDPDEAALSEYQTRLSRVLSVDIPPPTPPTGLTAPRAAALQQDIAGGSLGTLDFLTLTGCELQVTIGKRNSSLGRFASASQRLLLDLEFLRLALACIEHQRAKQRNELADLLTEAQALKRLQLPELIYNATLAGPEFRALWARPDTLQGYPSTTGTAVIQSLHGLLALSDQWLAGDYQADNRSFELLLGEIARGDAGALMLALERQAVALRRASAMAQQRLDAAPLCLQQRPTPQGRILDTVVRSYFIAALQPRAADLNRRHHDLLTPITELEERLETALTADYRQWKTQRDARIERFLAAPLEHVRSIRPLLAQCGLAPGQFSDG